MIYLKAQENKSYEGSEESKYVGYQEKTLITSVQSVPHQLINRQLSPHYTSKYVKLWFRDEYQRVIDRSNY